MWPKMRYEKQVDQVIIFRIFLNLLSWRFLQNVFQENTS